MKYTEHPYEYTMQHTAYLTDKQADLVREARKKDRKYRIVTTVPRMNANHIKDSSVTELMCIDDILPQWFYMVHNIKENHIGNKSSLVIENIDDMFFVIVVDIKTEEVLAEYMLEGAIVWDI